MEFEASWQGLIFEREQSVHSIRGVQLQAYAAGQCAANRQHPRGRGKPPKPRAARISYSLKGLDLGQSQTGSKRQESKRATGRQASGCLVRFKGLPQSASAVSDARRGSVYRRKGKGQAAPMAQKNNDGKNHIDDGAARPRWHPGSGRADLFRDLTAVQQATGGGARRPVRWNWRPRGYCAALAARNRPQRRHITPVSKCPNGDVGDTVVAALLFQTARMGDAAYATAACPPSSRAENSRRYREH